MAALEYRLAKIERTSSTPACVRAQGVAGELGFEMLIVCEPVRKWAAARRILARELRRRGWAWGEIATGLRCSEKTVARYLAAGGSVQTGRGDGLVMGRA